MAKALMISKVEGWKLIMMRGLMCCRLVLALRKQQRTARYWRMVLYYGSRVKGSLVLLCRASERDSNSLLANPTFFSESSPT